VGTDRINPRLSKPLVEHLGNRDSFYVKEAILDGYRDVSTGRYFKSTGDFKKDIAFRKKKEKKGWA
jgi:hypothetical protein